jgi:hypothetical protein
VQPLALAVDLIRGRAEPTQHGLGHRERDLALAGKHVVGAGAAELRHVAQVRAAHEDVLRRVQFPRRPDRLGGAGVGAADDQGR